MMSKIKRRSKILVIARESKAAHFENSIKSFDPKCILKKTTSQSIFTVVTSTALEEISGWTSVKMAETISSFPIKMSELLDFYRSSNLTGNETVLLKEHENAPANFANIDFDFDHQRFMVSTVTFETPIGPIKLLEDQISLGRGDFEMVASDGRPIIYLNLICEMLVFGSH